MLARALIPLTPLALTTAALAQCPQLSVVPGCGYNGVYPSAERMILWDPDGPGPRTEVVLISGVEIAGERVCNGFATWDGTNLEPLPGMWTEKTGDVVVWNGGLFATTKSAASPAALSPGGRAGVFRYGAAGWDRVGPESFAPLGASMAVYDESLIVCVSGIAPVIPSALYRWEDPSWAVYGPPTWRIVSAQGRLLSYDFCCLAEYRQGVWEVLASGGLLIVSGVTVNGNTTLLRWNGGSAGTLSSTIERVTPDGFVGVTGSFSSTHTITGAVQTGAGVATTRAFSPPRSPFEQGWSSFRMVGQPESNDVEVEGSLSASADLAGQSLIGGTLRSLAERPVTGIAAYQDDGAWWPLIGGISGGVVDSCVYNGQSVVLVRRSGARGAEAFEVHAQDADGWRRLGQRFSWEGPRVSGVFELAGELYVAADRLYRLQDGEWTAGPGAGMYFYRRFDTFGGEVLLSNSEGLYAFDGSTLRSLLAAPLINDVVVVPDGLVAAVGSRVRRLGPSGWADLGPALPFTVNHVAATPSAVFAFERSSSASAVRWWNGAQWQPLTTAGAPTTPMWINHVASVGDIVYVAATVDGGAFPDYAKCFRISDLGWEELVGFQGDSVSRLQSRLGQLFILGEGLKDGRGGGGWLLRYGPGPNPCPADLDCTGGIDGDDIIAFFAAWESGAISADMNGDSEVDGDDVTGFFERWDVGC